MTYGEFKKEAENNDIAKFLLGLWLNRKAPLYPLIELYVEKYQGKNTIKQLTFDL